MITQRDALFNTLYEQTLNDKDIVILSADFGAPALDKIVADRKEQFYHLGISEQNLIDVAIGMALKGKKVFTYAMAPFISLRCAEQHKLAAMMQLPIVNIVAGVGLGYANAGPTHYASEDYSLAVNTIGAEVYTFSDAGQVSLFVEHYLSKPHHCFLRLDREPLPPIAIASDFDIGFRLVIGSGKVGIISHGYCVAKIKAIIEKHNLQQKVTLIDLFHSKPMPKSLQKQLQFFEKLVVVDEQIETSSLGQFLALAISRENPDLGYETVCLKNEFMFENVGREQLVELSGINEAAILEKIS